MTESKLFQAKINQLREIEKKGIFDISINEITLIYQIGEIAPVVERKLSSENLQSFSKSLTRLRHSAKSVSQESLYLIENFLDAFQKALSLQTNLHEYHIAFSFHFTIQIQVREMTNKYSCYKSFFLDIIPLRQPQKFENQDFEFS
jgi:hypothetical protein